MENPLFNFEINLIQIWFYDIKFNYLVTRIYILQEHIMIEFWNFKRITSLKLSMMLKLWRQYN